MSTIELKCPKCGNDFCRRKAEYNRSKKKGMKSYCSQKCAAHIKNIPKESMCWDHLDSANRKDKYSPFRWHLKAVRRRSKNAKNKKCKEQYDVTLDYLYNIWSKQKGKCPFTGWKLKNMEKTSRSAQLPLTPDRASLDRIDSNKGYVKGNVRFVSYMAQCARNEFDDKDLLLFCESVVKRKET